MQRLLRSGFSTLLVLVGLVGVAGPAHAANVACGQTILVSTVLDGDIGPCANGVTIGANNITFDLGGHTITGGPATGEGAGVVASARTGVTVKNGLITLFDAGRVALVGGSGNTITDLRIRNNRGSFTTDFGDGIALFGSHNNRITANAVDNNGPYDGIGLVRSNGNTIDGNQITNNNQSSTNTAGIRLENAGFVPSNSNVVTNNQVINSGTFGIQIFAGGSDNVVRSNLVVASALDGITAFAGANRNVIQNNSTRNNRGSGVYVRTAAGSFPTPSNNQVLGNGSSGNAVFDLRDGTANCGTTQWHANTGSTGSPPCVFNP